MEKMWKLKLIDFIIQVSSELRTHDVFPFIFSSSTSNMTLIRIDHNIILGGVVREDCLKRIAEQYNRVEFCFTSLVSSSYFISCSAPSSFSSALDPHLHTDIPHLLDKSV